MRVREEEKKLGRKATEEDLGSKGQMARLGRRVIKECREGWWL
jgi:hypothetical protein